MDYQVKILSIDGGGIRGIIPAMILAEIERRTQKQIFSLFDLIAGTSTGGILGLGLAKPKLDPNDPNKFFEPRQAEYSAQDLLEMYVNHGAEIFFEPFYEQILGEIDDIVRPRYSSDGRNDVLKRYFGNIRLKEALTEVLVTSYDIELRTPVFFTNKIEKQETESRVFRKICSGFNMRQAAMATSAAPTYFSPYHLPTSQSPSGFYTLIDGGVFVNNPANLAIMEAIIDGKKTEKPVDLDKILLVSLGTGSLTKRYRYDEAKNWGLLGWVQPLLNIMLDGSSEAVASELEQLLPKSHDKPKQYYRFQTFLSAELEAMDNTKLENIRKLKEVALQIIEENNKDLNELCDQLLRNFSEPKKDSIGDESKEAPVWGTSERANKKAVIYQEANYQGASQELAVGNYDIDSLTIGNDNLSSLKVFPGLVVTLYEHAGYSGRSKVFLEDTPYVGDDFNNLTSSIKVELAIPQA